ncbi:helix-turn-helix domain-containing protein [Xanthomonas arboricola]|uniref:helix-turn-helix domain-containing protein n=1 Tax=Xanthomonas arboricola TaxID=56448 RepID=UPI003CCF400F
MTLPQAADYLKLHPVTLRGMMKTRKHPPGRKLGGRWRFHKAALDAYLSGEPWQEAPTPSSLAARKTHGTSATPTQADSAYFEALGLRPDARNRVGVKAPRGNVPHEPPRRETTAPLGRSRATLACRQTGQAQPGQGPA